VQTKTAVIGGAVLLVIGTYIGGMVRAKVEKAEKVPGWSA
jgi:hypothetical protein